MKRMIGLGLAVAGMTTGSAALAQGDICDDVREVVAAACETPPFVSFPDANPRDGRRMFGFDDCGHANYPDEGALFKCGWPGPDMNVSPDELMSRITHAYRKRFLPAPNTGNTSFAVDPMQGNSSRRGHEA